MIETIERQNIVDVIYQKMLNMILAGNWKQDTMIPSENELSMAFSVSRDTVRQAINRFSALGILKSRQGKGTFVCKMDTSFYMNTIVPVVFLGEDNIIQTLEFMKAIQVESVRIACKTASDEEILVLGDLLEKMRAVKGDYDKFFFNDLDYHRHLVKITRNHLFEKAVEIAEQLLQVSLKGIVSIHGSEKSFHQHDECFQAIKDRDLDRALSVMSEHYDMLLERTREWMEMEKNRLDEKSS